MARPEPTQNVYEESAEDLRNVLKKSEAKGGENFGCSVSRPELLQQHERHLRFLAEGALQLRTFILPPAYTPAYTPVLNAKKVRIQDLCVERRDKDQIVVLRAIADPYVHSSSIAIVEDESGDVARLTVCNLEDSLSDSLLERDFVVAVRQPCFCRTVNGSYHIRVDHPSDVIRLEPDSEMIPNIWKEGPSVPKSLIASQCKREGDMMFLKKSFRKALDLYERGRSLLETSKPAELLELYRKRCNVNIVLLRFDDAALDLAHAISVHASITGVSAGLGVLEFSELVAWLHGEAIEQPPKITSHLSRPLKDLAARIRFDYGICQHGPDYDFARISSYVGPLTLHVDAASYISDTEVIQTSRHGRGLFAKRDFKTGDLVVAEKAFALPPFLFNDHSSECFLYSLDNETTTDRAGALLFKELIQKLEGNPTLRKAFFDMDDGGYWEKHGWEVAEEDKIPVDVFRVEQIRRRNCFAAPLRTLDILTSPTPVRNGFWIHTSYINHSCLPNSVRTFFGDMLFLRASRDILAGEEITSQYISPEVTSRDRQQRYRGTWGFDCDCKLCAADSKAGSDVENQRMAIFEDLRGTAQSLGSAPTTTSLKKFARRLKELEGLYDEQIYALLPRLCLVHPTLFLTEAWRVLGNTDKTIVGAIRLLSSFGIVTEVSGSTFSIVKNSGMINVECVRALKYIAEAYAGKGESELADSVFTTAKVWFTTITGSDLGSEQFLSS